MSREAWLAVAFVAAAAVAYGVGCWWFPFKKCGCCRGKAIHLREDGKVWRTCGGWRCLGRGCGATGRKLRFGRRVYGVLRRLVRDAT